MAIKFIKTLYFLVFYTEIQLKSKALFSRLGIILLFARTVSGWLCALMIVAPEDRIGPIGTMPRSYEEPSQAVLIPKHGCKRRKDDCSLYGI